MIVQSVGISASYDVKEAAAAFATISVSTTSVDEKISAAKIFRKKSFSGCFHVRNSFSSSILPILPSQEIV